ncbi:MAG: hypothetical protein AAGU05_06240 [Anaerolineaceae bacterium]
MPEKPKRPMGVWALTIYSLLSAGLLPTLIAVNAIISNNAGYDLYGVILSMLLGLIIILLTVGTWQGRDIARKLYLVSISLHYALIVLNNGLLLGSGIPAADEVSTLWQQILLSVVLLATNWVYFNLRSIKAFYQPAGA